MSILSDILARLIIMLRLILGLPGCCKYTISCSAYAIEKLKNENLFKAFLLIFIRILSCNPFYPINNQKIKFLD